MFYNSFVQPAKAVFLSCAISLGGFSTSTLADEQETYGALAVDISADRGETLQEQRSQRIQDWQERVAKSREAFLKRMEERRTKRVSTLRAVDSDGVQRRKARRPMGGRAEDDGWTWSFLKPRASSTNETTNPKLSVVPKGKYGALIAKYAKQHGVPYSLARAVVQVESTFRPNVTGGAGEIGLMQIKFATARGMGYKGSRKQLYNPATNLYWGMKYLGKAYSLSGGTTCGTILRYNAGHGAKRMNKVSSRYCGKVKRILA